MLPPVVWSQPRKFLLDRHFFPFRPFLVPADAPDPTPVLEPASPANPSWIAALPRPVLVTVDVAAHALTCFRACQPREPLLEFLFSFRWTACSSPSPCGQVFTRLAMTRTASSWRYLRTDLHRISPISRSVGFPLDSSSPDFRPRTMLLDTALFVL